MELIYLALPSSEMSALRVAERVAHGGHSIPQHAIRRRFSRSLRHLLHEFSHRVDRCTCFMNHAARPVLVFEQNGLTRTVHDPSWYQLLLRQAQA
jgi:predicted ABC-type ATPase